MGILDDIKKQIEDQANLSSIPKLTPSIGYEGMHYIVHPEYIEWLIAELEDYKEEKWLYKDLVYRYRKALEEIAEGEGPFSTDPLTHAGNTIDSMKAIATKVLRAVTSGRGE